VIKEVPSHYDPQKVEKRILKLWDDKQTYHNTRECRKGGRQFFFVDGPPYTTGNIHLGTAWNKIIKDAMLRYKSMKGFDVLDRAGWDMHGLPIEVKVEESLGFKTKKDIEAYGVDKFVDMCKRFALQHKDQMTAQFQRLGVWLDWENPYMTATDEYIEAAWWTLKQAHKKGLLEQGRRVVNWCPRCETAIADSEVEYKDRTDPSIYVKFPVVGEKDTYIVIWTTTPWTIPSNIAVAVHPGFEYARVRVNRDGKEEILILASELVECILKEGNYQDYDIIETMLGKDVAGMEYRHPLDDLVPRQKEFTHKVYLADFVTAENTGCVHIAPGHGLDDFLLGMEHGLPIFCPVGPDGRYTADAGAYAGKYVFDANSQVIEDLEKSGYLLAHGRVTHRYGHCWRCETPIIYLATKQWFIKVSSLKDEMLKAIERVKWYPEWAGSARFRDWVEGARDWCISRQRYWGIPLPIWTCECGEIEILGTLDELRKKSKMPSDLHRPHIDGVVFKCPKCNKTMHRVKDVFDVWFDSAVASWATLDFPRNREKFEKWWPPDFITEGHDQTRGWFYSQLGASMVAFDKVPYKSVLMHGFTLDELGRKMSKSLGNVVTPEEVIDKYGVDTLRFYLLLANAPWEDIKFNWKEVQNVRRMLDILWNVYRFPLTYMALDNFDPSAVSLASVSRHLRLEDKWILSRTQSLIREVEEAMEACELHVATRALQNFVLEDLSHWYIQLIRPRTWIEAEDPDKLAAYRVIYDTLMTVIKLLAPFTPFMAEEMYQNLASSKMSVHMCDWPKVDKSLMDKSLEAHMDIARSIVDAASTARQKVKRKLRWPVKRIIVAPGDEDVVEATQLLEKVIKAQANAKEIVLLKVGEEWDEVSLEVLPDQSVIGPKFKKNAAKVIRALEKVNGKTLRKAIARGYKLKLDKGEVKITRDMVHFRESLPEHIGVAEFLKGRVYVDAELTDEIKAEGYAKEIIRRIQDMRKELDLNVEDEINVLVQIKSEDVARLIENWKTFISTEVRAKRLDIAPEVKVKGDLVKRCTVEGVEMEFGIRG